MRNRTIPYQKTLDFWEERIQKINGMPLVDVATRHPQLMLKTVEAICTDMDKALLQLNELREENQRLRVELGLKRFLE